MRRLGIREFRDKATKLLASGEVLAVERHGALVGYFVPARADREAAVEGAIERLRTEAGADVLAELRARRDEILDVCRQRGASNVRVFGSVVRGEATAESDVDLLVDLEPGRSLLDHSGLVCDLSDILGRSVDVVPERSLKPELRGRVLQDAEPL